MTTEGFIAPEASDLTRWMPGYEVIELVACGGMGAVYRARQLSLDRYVAIKVLPPELAADETFRGSFEAEAKAMAQLAHSNLIGVFDFGSVEDMLYLVMEFVEGNTLYRSGHGQAVDAECAIGLVKAVARGLGEAHKHGIVHRDIKPANILITPELVAKLGDFGLAVPRSDVGSGLMMGTPGYLAPEVLADPLAAGFASDTFALGVILYELLTGQSVEGGQAVDLGLVPPQAGLRDLVHRATSGMISMRFQDGAELAEALAKWEKNKGKQAVPAAVTRPAPPRTVVVYSGGKSGRLMAVAAVAVLAVGAFFFLNGRNWTTNEVATDPAAETETVRVEPSSLGVPLVSGTGDDVGNLIAKPVGQPAGEPGDPASLPDLGKWLDEQRKLVLAENKILQARRRENWDEFQSAITDRGKLLLVGVSGDLGAIPRHFPRGEVVLSEKLAGLFDEYAIKRQEEADRQFRERLRALHVAALKDIQEGAAGIPDELRGSPEAWLEFLGLNPLEVACRSLCGAWADADGGNRLGFVVKNNGKAHWMSGPDASGPVAHLEAGEQGRIILRGADGDDREWTLRWRKDELVGADGNGKSYRFRREPFDFFSLVDESLGEDPLGGGIAKNELADREVRDLREKYLQALKKKIEPLEAGYLRVLTKADQLYASRGEEQSQERIAREVQWVRALAWRDGQLAPGGLPQKATDLPVGEDLNQNTFLKTFRERYEKTRQQYLSGLKKLKQQRLLAGKPFAAIDRELESLGLNAGSDPDAGVVSARHVKLKCLKAPGAWHAALAEFVILDRDGKPLGRYVYGQPTCSSFAPNSGEPPALDVPEKAFDGDVGTHWHTLRSDGGHFPHWIAVDLKMTRKISGFRILPRQGGPKDRKPDIVNWVLDVSKNGRTWREVARGTFRRGSQWNEHHGLKEKAVAKNRLSKSPPSRLQPMPE